jgi:lactate dehydrogenase-like 2-hydroxyacid dehydrogenase
MDFVQSLMHLEQGHALFVTSQAYRRPQSKCLKSTLPLDSPWRVHPKVTEFPHVGSAMQETRRVMAELATENLLLVLSGQNPLAKFEQAHQRNGTAS